MSTSSRRSTKTANDVAKRRKAGRPSKSENNEDKRKTILRSAARVFAQKGYHGCRIADIADDAQVAYGLVYHYFGNKEALLSVLFETNWTIFARAVEQISKSEESLSEKLEALLDFLMNVYRRSPNTVTVLVNEYARNLRLVDALNVPAVDRVFALVDEIFRTAKEKGELPKDAHVRSYSILFLGSIETTLASLVMQAKRSPGRDQEHHLEMMRTTLMRIFKSTQLDAGTLSDSEG